MRWLMIWALLALPVLAQDRPAGDFDYYVLSLSWSPSWCALEGDARGSPQCEPRHDHGWILHGLWPQYHQGWPADCQTAQRPPTRAMTRDMADIMGTPGLAWYQWNKHGTCAGMTATAYFDLAREAYDQVTRPPVFRKLTDPVTLPAHVVEDAFVQSNPGLTPDMITITCRDGHIQEARLCLSKSLAPVPCGADVIRDCALDNAQFPPIR